MQNEIPLEAALANATRNRKSSHWPSGGGPNRLEPFYDPILQPRFHLAPGARIFTIGSCFARNIEEHLGSLGFDVPALSLSIPPEEYNPGPSIVDKFTPPAALQEVERTLAMIRHPERRERIIDEVLFPTTDGRVIDLELREFVPVTRERAHARRQHIFDIFAQAFDADCVVITLGLVECWLDRKTGRAIQETPHALALRRAGDRFAFKILDVAEVIDASERMIRLLIDNGRPGVNILLTVSPIPMRATFSGMDAVIANAYSKATLRCAAQILRDRFEQVDYFPSYEMVTLSRLPDIWQRDLIHVNPGFVARVVDVLVRAYLPGAPPAPASWRTLATLDGPFAPMPPLGWSATLPPGLLALCDGHEEIRRSPLLLFEDETELGPGHRAQKQIFQLGGGGYSCWLGMLYFSTSEGSDPNTGRHRYTIRVLEGADSPA